MARNLLTLWLCLCGSLAFGQAYTFRDLAAQARAVPVAGGGAPTYLAQETFENGGAGGYDGGNFLVWAEDSNPTENYATAPAPLAGSFSFHSTADGSRAHCTIASVPDIWIWFHFNGPTLPNGSGWVCVTDGPSNYYMEIGDGAAGRIRINHGSASALMNNALSASTTYHILLHFTKGTGANGFASVEFSTTATFLGDTGSNNNFVKVTTGTATVNFDTSVYIGLGKPGDIILDNLKISSTDPGLTPP